MEIHSVSSTTANRPTASSTSEAVAGTDDSSVPTATETKTTGAGGYISPFLRYDQGARVAVLLFRDVDTGETQDQVPSRRVVEEYRRAAGRVQQPTDKSGVSASNGSGQTAAAQTPASPHSAGSGAAARGISFASTDSTAATATAPTGADGHASASGGLVSVSV